MRSTRSHERNSSDDSYEDVTPRGGTDRVETPAARLGRRILTDTRLPEETVRFDENSSDHEGEEPDPSLDQEPNPGVEETKDGDEDSQVSSSYSIQDEVVNTRDLLDLTDTDRYCMVRMVRQINGRLVSCVCGRERPCSRRNHTTKRTQNLPGTIGSPGFFMPADDRNFRGDGRLDTRWYTPEELQAIEIRTRQERDDAAEELGAPGNEPEGTEQTDRQGSVTFGGSTYHGGAPPEGNDSESDDDSESSGVDTPRRDNGTQARRPDQRRRQSGSQRQPTGTGGNPRAEGGDDPTLWYCMIRPSTQRVATNQAATMLTWQAEGAHLDRVVRTRAEAEAWIASGNRNPPEVLVGPNPRVPIGGGHTDPIDVDAGIRRQVPAHQGTDRRLPEGRAATPEIETTNQLHSLLTTVSRFSVGEDPSVGTKQIFGVDPADSNRMDTLLLPPTVEDREARQDFYDLAMDVASLPGGYRSTDDDDHSPTELLVHALGRNRSSYFRNWRKPTHNALGRIKSAKELMQFVRDVEKMHTRNKASQDHRMRSFLHSCHIPSEVIGLYLQSGLLLRVVQDTFRFYLGLLESLRSAQWEMSSASWKDGYVDRMIQHHSLEMAQIRATAADYRMHLLETYVYLRNAHKEKYQDPSFTRHLLYAVATNGFGTTSESTTPRDTDGAQASTRCKHCRRNGVHSGITKDDCLLKGLSARKAQSALANLNKTQARTVARAIKEKLSADPSGDVDEIISNARAAV